MEPFKNLFNPITAEKIAISIKKNYSKFDTRSFLNEIESTLETLELKERVDFLARRIHSHLPVDPNISIPILVNSLKKNETDNIGLSQFSAWPFAHFISIFGLEHFDLSMNALKEITKLFTSEFAVRAFFITNQKKTLKFFKIWVDDENEHVRRLVSEGSRPLLPWGIKLQCFVDDPNITWDLLEKLKNDPSEYVRKSVANHINDHSKNHPDFVIDKLLKWHKTKNKKNELEWVIKQASRTLIKKGYQKAFLLHGVEGFKIKIIDQKIKNKKVKLGENLEVVVKVKNMSNKSTRIIIDHEMHFLKMNKNHKVKIFKGKKILLDANEIISVELKVPLKRTSTRVYYNGRQFWNIKINGIGGRKYPFSLIVEG